MIYYRRFHLPSLEPKYKGAKPYPNLTLDNFLSKEDAEYLAANFPKPGDIEFYQYNSPLELKMAQNDLSSLSSEFNDIVNRFNSASFVAFLEQLTGIENLIPDPKLYGGGLHLHGRGGKLDIHADFNTHPHLKLSRRLNVILYLNKDWKYDWGGQLELWNKNMNRCVVKIAPFFNRLAIFQINDTAFHGVPVPIRCPEGVYRKSLAFYYYTNGRPPEEQAEPHKVSFQRRPGDSHDHDALREARKKGERYQ